MLPTAFHRTIFPHTFQAADPAAEILPAFQREEKRHLERIVAGVMNRAHERICLPGDERKGIVRRQLSRFLIHRIIYRI